MWAIWRREWDSNPRNCRSQLFESCTLNHSDISPYKLCFLSFSLPLKTGEKKGEKIQESTTNNSRKVVGNQQLLFRSFRKTNRISSHASSTSLSTTPRTGLLYQSCSKKSRFFRQCDHLIHFLHDFFIIFPSVGF